MNEVQEKISVRRIARVALDIIVYAWIAGVVCGMLNLPVFIDWLSALILTKIHYCISDISLGGWFFCIKKEKMSQADYVKIGVGGVIFLFLAITFFV